MYIVYTLQDSLPMKNDKNLWPRIWARTMHDLSWNERITTAREKNVFMVFHPFCLSLCPTFLSKYSRHMFFLRTRKTRYFPSYSNGSQKKKQTVELCLSASSIYHMRDFNVSILTLFSLKQHAKETYRKWKALLMQQYRANCTEQKANKIQLKS